MGLKAQNCRVNIAGLGSCESICRRCGVHLVSGQAIMVAAKAVWLRNKAADIHDVQVYHAVCPTLDERRPSG
jgi:hypothetical protein